MPWQTAMRWPLSQSPYRSGVDVRIGLAVPGLNADAVELAVLRAGHDVAWRAADLDEVLSHLAQVAPDVVLIADHPAVATTTVVGSCDLLGVRACLVIDDRPMSSSAARLELADVVRLDSAGGLDLTPIEALPLTSGSREPAIETTDLAVPSVPVAPTPPPAPSLHAPLVITVWGPTGAPGRTTIATALAAELADRGLSVVLIDADTYGGTIAPALGLLDEAPGFAAACRLAGAETLSATELDRVSQPATATGFAVLTGIGRPHRWPELSTTRVQAVIEACRHWRTVIVIDAGFSLESDEEISSDIAAPRRNAATLAALRSADRVVAVGAADPLGLARFLRIHADLLEAVETSQVQVVVNRVRASVLGLDPHGQVRQTLDRFAGVRDAVLIDNDPDAADAALLTARPVTHAAPRSALASGVRTLADRLVPASAAPRGPRGRGWLRRTGSHSTH